jgi:lysophospholipase L1-like esterase
MRRIVTSMLCGLALWVPAHAQAPVVEPAARAATILFVGSSIFHRWTNLAAHMAPLPVTNRAVDGLMTTDLLRRFDADVMSIRPRVLVYYCGSNDVDAGDSAAPIVDRIRQYVERVAAALPATRVVFMSVNRAPEKRALWEVVDAVNRGVQTYAEATRRLQYVEVNPVLFNADGSPRMELYMPDELHFRPPAYDEFAKILKPVLTKAFDNH